MSDERKQCPCGWRRPLISLTTTDGAMPPSNVLPTYTCPQCGAVYVAAHISHEVAARVRSDLERELAAARRRS